MKLLIIYLFFFLFIIPNVFTEKTERNITQVGRFGKYKAGQQWKYKTRKGEEASTVTIEALGIDEELGSFAYINIDKLNVQNELPNMSYILLVTELALNNSVIEKISESTTKIKSVSFPRLKKALEMGDQRILSFFKFKNICDCIDAQQELLQAIKPEKENEKQKKLSGAELQERAILELQEKEKQKMREMLLKMIETISNNHDKALNKYRARLEKAKGENRKEIQMQIDQLIHKHTESMHKLRKLTQ